jgi:hypothetical protein
MVAPDFAGSSQHRDLTPQHLNEQESTKYIQDSSAITSNMAPVTYKDLLQADPIETGYQNVSLVPVDKTPMTPMSPQRVKQSPLTIGRQLKVNLGNQNKMSSGTFEPARKSNISSV